MGLEITRARLLVEALRVSWTVKRSLGVEKDLGVLLGLLDVSDGPSTADDGAAAADLARATVRAQRIRGLRDRACVQRTLTLFVLWSKRGRPCTFMSGVARRDGQLTGHAWLEAPDLPPEVTGDRLSRELFAENLRYANKAAAARQAETN